jgi:hypothetical protein
LGTRSGQRLSRVTRRPGTRTERHGNNRIEARWTSVLDADFDNLRTAHRWAVELGDADLALRLSDGLYYYVLGQFRDEVVSRGATALELPDAHTRQRFSAVCGAVGEGLTLRGEHSCIAGWRVPTPVIRRAGAPSPTRTWRSPRA